MWRLLVCAVFLAASAHATEEFEGYRQFNGECKAFDIGKYWHWNAEQCRNQCNKDVNCAGFFFIEKGNEKSGYYKWSQCNTKFHICDAKYAVDTDDTQQHMYRRVGFSGMQIAGWTYKRGKCADMKIIRTHHNYYPSQCVTICVALGCTHFSYTSDKKCYLSKDTCNEDSTLIDTDDGKTFVFFPDPDTGRNEAIFRTVTASSYQSHLMVQTKAVDGYRYPMVADLSCWVSHTHHPDPWIKVTLGKIMLVQKIAVTNRDDELQEEMKHIDLVVQTKNQKPYEETEICAKIETHFRGRRLFDCGEPLAGKYVTVMARDLGEKRRIAVCELEVYASKYDPLVEYEMEEKKYFPGNRMDTAIAAYSSGKDYTQCAILCNAQARCAGFMAYFNGVCYFMFYTCTRGEATAHGHFNIYRRKNHAGLQVPGFKFGGICTDIIYQFKYYGASDPQKCGASCNNLDRCQAYYLNNANLYCYLYDKKCTTFREGNGNFWFTREERNAALLGSALQISTYAARAASLATDGIMSTDLRLGSCSQTLPAKVTWWAVDMRFNTKVEAVAIWNRKDRGETDNLRKLKIYVTKKAPFPGQQFGGLSDELCASRTDPVGDYAKIDCREIVSGRFAVIKRELSSAEPLVLCEVAVYGEKDYDVHGYTREYNQPPDCTYMNVKLYNTQKYTPAQCGDQCNQNKNCASFLYLNNEDNPQCWLKARHCTKKAARPNDKYIYYDKIGHPGFSAAGYESRVGQYIGGYTIRGWGALDPAACAAKCEETPACFAMTMHWVNGPSCTLIKDFDTETITWHNADHYATLIKREPNLATNLATSASASFDQSEQYAADGCMSPHILHHSCSRVQSTDGITWWSVDLGKATYVNGVKILSTRDELVSSLNSLVVVVTDNEPLKDFDSTEVCIRQGTDVPRPGEVLQLTCSFPVVGRYVVLVKEKDEQMTLCEVLVDGEVSTDENLALEKETDQISTEGTGLSSKAVDGKYNTHLDKDTCAQTKQDFEDRVTWWSVDLGKVHAISAIKIRNRGDCCGGELRKITLAVSMDKPDWNYEPHDADICNYREKSLPFNATYSFRCREPAVGQYVIISKNIPKTDLVLCEVEVFGKEIKPYCAETNAQPEATCVLRKSQNWCTGHPNWIHWMSVYCRKSCLCKENAEVVAFWPLIASYKAKDTQPGKSDGALSDPKLVKSSTGPIDQPYTAFKIIKDPESYINFKHTDAMTLKDEGTFGLYIYQSGFIDDSVVAEWSSGNIQLKIESKRIVGIVKASQWQEYRVVSGRGLEPDTWYFVAISFNLEEGKLSVFTDTKLNTMSFGKMQAGDYKTDDIIIGGHNFGGRVTCAQLYPSYMELLQVLAARAACKTYLKSPGDTAVNVAKGKPAFQSTTWTDAAAGRATDGSDAPYFWRNSCTATVQGPGGMKGPHWWSVDLQKLRAVTSVRVVNRMYGNPERLHDFRVLVTLGKPESPIGYDATDICAYHKGAFKGGQSKILTCKRALPGRYVTITKPDPSQLTLCEVEVYGELVLPQPESTAHSLSWTCEKIDDVRRTERLIIRKEVSNLKLCHRACLLESSFKCTSVEYDRKLKWCRLYTSNRKIVKDVVAQEAALADDIDAKAAEHNTITNSNPEQRVSRIQRLQNSIATLEKEREEMENLGSSVTDDTKKQIETRLLNDRQELKALHSGTVLDAGTDIDEEQDLGVRPHAELLYCHWTSVEGVDARLTCPKVNNKQTEKEWETKENWVLNVFPDMKLTEVEHSWECREMCEREKNFVCMSYAHNHELKTCSLWSVNPAVPGVGLIVKQQSTYHQWSCREQLPPCVCWIGGDPHYQTFDKKAYDNQGGCKYMTAEYANKNDICRFAAEHKNEKRGGGPSWIAVMDLKILGHTIRFTHPGQIWYDGVLVTDLGDANAKDPRIQLRRVGKRNELDVPGCGVSMAYDGVWNYFFQLSRRKYAGKIGGLCGNCDKNSGNDFISRETGKATSAGGFANSWEVFDDSGLNHVCKRIAEPSPCEGEWVRKVKEKDYCGYILDYAGPFGTCIRDGRINQAQLYKECVYDVCQLAHNPTKAKEMACGGVERVVEECAKLRLPFKTWRTPGFCPMDCGRNMEYSPKISGCPETCADPEAPKTCTQPDQEGCRCVAGYILNDKGKCIVQEMCSPKCKNDIAFCLDQSEVMGAKLSASARDMVASIVDSFHISPTTTQVSIVPYADEPSDVILYNTHGSRAETVEAVRNLRLLKGSNHLHKCVRYVEENIFTEELRRSRPEDTYIRTLIIVTGTDVAEDDAVTELTKNIYRRGGKVLWIKYNSEKAPPARDLTIGPYVLPVPNPDDTEDLVDEIAHLVCKESKCKSGYYSRRYPDYETCDDIDECRLELCSEGSSCMNTQGAFKCQCPKGFCFNAITGCEEINECARNPCLPGSRCENTRGSYECSCREGYRYDMKRSCLDIDECQDGDICDGDATCANDPGSYKCTCPAKKTYLLGQGCSLENPCKEKLLCGANAVCVPKKGGYDCVCPEGMYHVPKKGCMLKMPCGDKPCKGDHVTCVQHAGQYECLCPNMNIYDPDIGCQPLDPCLAKPCKGQSKCTVRGTEFYCGCERGLYYNPEVGCEEPETRVPMVKVIMILDDSDKVGERVFEYIKAAARQISVTLAGNSETLNMGIWLAGGKATVVLEMGIRPVDDYGEFIEDIEFKGGAYKLEDVIALIQKNEGVNKEDNSQVIIVVLTGNNVDHSSHLKPTCSKLEDKTENKCNHMVILYGHENVKDPDDSYYILLQNAIELYGVHSALGIYAASWMTCPSGFVRIGDKCRIEGSVLYKCKAKNGEVYAADAIWSEDCITYKCVRNGATPIKGECRDTKGNCRPANGESYQCILKGELREKCRCSVEIKDGEAVRKVSYIEWQKEEQAEQLTYGGTAGDSKCHFPFYYQGELVWQCSTRQSSTPWCATTDNWDVDKKWGYCKPGPDSKVCEYEGKNYYEGSYWWRGCDRFKCTEFGIQVKTPRCKSKGSQKCVAWGAEDFPCEINGKNYDACVCAGSKNKAELFAISSRETVEEAYGGGNAESFCTMGDKEYQIGDKWEVDCSEFTCRERKTIDNGEVIGCTVEAIKVACRIEANAGQWLCLNVGDVRDDCGETTEGEKRSCSCTQQEEGLMISYKTTTRSWSVSAATTSYSYSFSSNSSMSAEGGAQN